MTVFDELAQRAVSLNRVSDQLTAQVDKIEATLKRFNLGVVVWIAIRDEAQEDGSWSMVELGYCRVGERWRIALLTTSGANRSDPNPVKSFSAFADAPRQLRIKAVVFIQELLANLVTEADKLIAAISPKVETLGAIVTELENGTTNHGG